MTFTRKSLQHTSGHRSAIFKYLTMFFLGASCVLWMTYAFDINPSLNNAIQYINKVFLTADGSNTSRTGLILDGTTGGGIWITNLTGKILLGTDPTGKITGSTAIGVYNFLSGVYTSGVINNLISGYYTSGNIYNSISGYIDTGYWTGVGANDIRSTNVGNVGVGGAPSGRAKLDIAGNLRVTGLPNPVVVLGTNSSGVLQASSAANIAIFMSGVYSSGNIYNLISGFITNSNGRWNSLNNIDIYNTNTGNVGIGMIPIPSENKLQIAGNITSSGFIERGEGVVVGTNSTAMGYHTEASDYYSTAMGYYTIASFYSTAMGADTYATGGYSTAMGADTHAIGASSTAMGHGTYATGVSSTAMGLGTYANGGNSTAMGEGTYANGSFSTAMGEGTHANGDWSTAMGYETFAYGKGSTAMGYETYANGTGSTAIGKYNIGITGAIFEIGIGTAVGYEKNAMTVLASNGYVGIGTTGPTEILTVKGNIQLTGGGVIKLYKELSDPASPPGTCYLKNGQIKYRDNSSNDGGLYVCTYSGSNLMWRRFSFQ